MDIDKSLIGKPPNVAVVINDKLINDKSEQSQDSETDTREKLEADVLAYLTPHEIEARLLGNAIIEWLNRQAAITEQEVRARERYGEKANYYGALAEDLACKLDILKDHGVEIVDAVGGGYEVYNQEKKRADELTVERDELKTRVAELESELKCYEGVDEAKEMWAKACQRERDKNAAMYAALGYVSQFGKFSELDRAVVDGILVGCSGIIEELPQLQEIQFGNMQSAADVLEQARQSGAAQATADMLRELEEKIAVQSLNVVQRGCPLCKEEKEAQDGRC